MNSGRGHGGRAQCGSRVPRRPAGGKGGRRPRPRARGGGGARVPPPPAAPGRAWARRAPIGWRARGRGGRRRGGAGHPAARPWPRLVAAPPARASPPAATMSTGLRYKSKLATPGEPGARPPARARAFVPAARAPLIACLGLSPARRPALDPDPTPDPTRARRGQAGTRAPPLPRPAAAHCANSAAAPRATPPPPAAVPPCRDSRSSARALRGGGGAVRGPGSPPWLAPRGPLPDGGWAGCPLPLVRRRSLLVELARDRGRGGPEGAPGHGRPGAGVGVCVQQPGPTPSGPTRTRRAGGCSGHPTQRLCILFPLRDVSGLTWGLFPRLGASRAWSESSPCPAWVFRRRGHKLIHPRAGLDPHPPGAQGWTEGCLDTHCEPG